MLEPLHSENSPFSKPQLRQLKDSLQTLDRGQALWLSGYLAGRLGAAEPLPAAASPDAANAAVLNILYGSDTGHGQAIAEQLAASAGHGGQAVHIQSMAQLRPAALKKMQHAVFIISTHGDGDPPDDALDVFDFLERQDGAVLGGLQYRVLALGDRSYSDFCAAGRTLDEHLQRLGATAFEARVECDLDYQADAAAWSEAVLAWTARNIAVDPGEQPAARLSLVSTETAWSRHNPFTASLLRRQAITGRGSVKDVHHLELSLAGSGLTYEPGDALAVLPENDAALVEEILCGLQIDPDTTVEIEGHSESVSALLTHQREITRLSADTVRNYASTAGVPELAAHFDGLAGPEQRMFIESRQFLDLVKTWPGELSARGLAELLRPLNSRAYSIASSQALVEDEVHLTVATLQSGQGDELRRGAASHGLNHRLQADGRIGVFLEKNPRFRLPVDPQTPLIMIAAGTGIAPYRAFMQQLEYDGNSPDSWLIFGNPHLRSDFLYQKEWLAFRKQGLVKRIDVAFSRDQAEKYYVQDVVREQAARINAWLSNGAQIYICGSLAMGAAVEQNLQQALAEARSLDVDAARDAVRELRRAGRLLKDLY